jgi:capsid protein
LNGARIAGAGSIGARPQFQPPHRSGDAAIWESDDLMARRVRNQVLNEPQIKRIRDALEDLIVGPGVRPLPTRSIRCGSVGTDARHTLDGYHLRAGSRRPVRRMVYRPQAIRPFRQALGPEVQRMLLGENVERGGCLLDSHRGKRPAIASCRCAIRSCRIRRARPFARSAAGPGKTKSFNGIELDALGREVAFLHLRRPSVRRFFGAAKPGRVRASRADRVIHTALFRRPSQSMGVNLGDAVAQPSFDRDKFVGSEIPPRPKTRCCS